MSPPVAYVPAHGFKVGRLARALAVAFGAQAVVVGIYLVGVLVAHDSPDEQTAIRFWLAAVLAEVVVASCCLGVAIASLIRLDLGRALGMFVGALALLIAHGYLGGAP